MTFKMGHTNYSIRLIRHALDKARGFVTDYGNEEASVMWNNVIVLRWLKSSCQTAPDFRRISDGSKPQGIALASHSR